MLQFKPGFNSLTYHKDSGQVLWDYDKVIPGATVYTTQDIDKIIKDFNITDSVPKEISLGIEWLKRPIKYVVLGGYACRGITDFEDEHTISTIYVEEGPELNMVLDVLRRMWEDFRVDPDNFEPDINFYNYWWEWRLAMPIPTRGGYVMTVDEEGFVLFGREGSELATYIEAYAYDELTEIADDSELWSMEEEPYVVYYADISEYSNIGALNMVEDKEFTSYHKWHYLEEFFREVYKGMVDTMPPKLTYFRIIGSMMRHIVELSGGGVITTNDGTDFVLLIKKGQELPTEEIKTFIDHYTKHW